MLAQQVVRCDEPIELPGELGGYYLLGLAVARSVVLGEGRQAEALEHPQAVGIERELPGRPREDEDLVRARLPNHGEGGEGASRLRHGKPEGSSQVSAPPFEDQFGGAVESRGAKGGGDGSPQAGDLAQCRLRGRANRLRAETHARAEGLKRLAPFRLGSEIRDLFPEDQLEGIPAYGSRRPSIEPPKGGDGGSEGEGFGHGGTDA